MQETQLQSLSWEDPLEKGIATHIGHDWSNLAAAAAASILAWRIPWTEEPGRLQSIGVTKKVGHDWATNTSNISSFSLLPLVFQLCICYSSQKLSQNSWIMFYSSFWFVPLLFHSFFFYISVWEVSIDTSSSLLMPYLTMSNLWMHPSKVLFIFVTVFLKFF